MVACKLLSDDVVSNGETHPCLAVTYGNVSTVDKVMRCARPESKQ